MNAAVVERYGSPEVVRIVDIPVPDPGRGEVRVRVLDSAVTRGDARIRGARFPRGFAPFARLALGLRGPRRRILGGVFAGVVDALGSDVTGIAVGDRVCGMTGVAMGCHAEAMIVGADRCVAIPTGVVSAHAAAMLFGGTTALHFLRDKVNLQSGMRVLVVGASGAVGSAAVQIARHLGADVTAVTSTANIDLVRELGASHVIDYTRTAPTGTFDIVIDTVGEMGKATGRRLLTDGGVLILVAADLWQTISARGNVHAGVSSERPENMAILLGWMANGALVPVIDSTYPLEDIAAAYARVDSGRKVGNVVLTIGTDR